MTSSYRNLRNAARNATKIGNHSAAMAFLEKAAACDWIEPADWRPHVCFARGIPLDGLTLEHTATFSTKKQAQDAARVIGWNVGDVTKVHHRLHGERWALVDGRFGLASRARIARLIAA